MATIDKNNYELWLLRYAEGELSDIESSEVKAWLAVHPEAAEELALYNEAPRLEADTSVTYAAAPTQPTSHPLWPVVLRWSAAAAILVALMLPALRMGTMDTREPQQPLLAAATTPGTTPNIPNTPSIPSTQSTLTTPINQPDPHLPENAIAAIETTDTVDIIDTTGTTVPPQIIYSNSLIVYEQPVDTIVTNTLVTYDTRRPILTERAREWVGDISLAQLFRK